MSAASDFYASGAKPWVSGKTYKQRAYVISLLDDEVYIHKTASVGGTTDPADDTTNYRPVSYTRTLALPSADMISGVSSNPALCFAGATRNIVGALAVGARTNVLSVSGRGAIDYLAYHKSAAGSARVEVIVDGITVLDRTDATYATTAAFLGIGQSSAGSAASNALAEARLDPNGVQFRRSLNIWVTNTATVGAASASVAYHLQSIA
jgi:hypothetical protein